MRNKIDYGIDLGTTNSAIARMENGQPIIKKSDIQKDTTPSCVHFNKKGDCLVGDMSFNALKKENSKALKDFIKGKTNTYLEFKRTMGTTHSYDCSNLGKELSSEELSAEVLKKLKSYIIDENVSSVVITVPAKFLNPQKDATLKAAKLAGFKHVELLQEPVAAATAYGLGALNKDGFWLVFDFGGGTFDAALVKAEEGILSVKDTDGDNWLGGKNLDEAIVDQIIIPYLKNTYSIDFVISDKEKLQMLREAVKPYAEELKNQLSFKESYSTGSNLDDTFPFEDGNGEEPEIDVTVTQKELEPVLMPIFQKAINITKELLKRNNLNGSDLTQLILVGGPTFSPILRKMLKEQISDKIDTSIDPMTAVAKGAALFASTISVSEEVKEETRDKTKLQLEINYQATSVELDEMINIAILKDKTQGFIPDQVFVELVRNDGAWSSSKKKIGEKKTLIDVMLNQGVSNLFEIHAFDELGNRLECQPNQFSILQGIGGLENMTVLPYNICIVKYFGEEGKDLIASITGLEKNKKVPATGVRNGLKTRNQIRPGMASDIIRIPVYQGAYGTEKSDPDLNDLVYEVIITGEAIPKFLPVGSNVDITIKVNRSEQMQFSAYFPAIDYTEEVEIDIKQTKTPEAIELTKKIAKAKRTAQAVNATEVTEHLETLEQQLKNEGDSADGKMKIQDGLRKELLKLDSAAKTAEWPQVEQALKEAFYELEDLIEKVKANGDTEELNMENIDNHLAENKKSIEQIIQTKDTKAAKELTEAIEFLEREVRNTVTQGSIDVKRIEFHDREFNSIQWKDKNKARQFVNQGLRLISEGQTNQLKPLLHQIWELRIDGGGDTTTLG